MFVTPLPIPVFTFLIGDSVEGANFLMGDSAYGVLNKLYI